MVFERQIISFMNLIHLTLFIKNGNNTFFLWIFPFCSVLRVLAYSWYLKCYYFGKFSQIWVDTVSDPFFIALAARNSNELFPVLSHAEYYILSFYPLSQYLIGLWSSHCMKSESISSISWSIQLTHTAIWSLEKGDR